MSVYVCVCALYLFICDCLCLRLYFTPCCLSAVHPLAPHLNSFSSVCCFSLVCICMFVYMRERGEQVQDLTCHLTDLCLIGALAVYQETSVRLSVCLLACLTGSSRSLSSTQMHRWLINKQWSMSPQQGFSHLTEKVSAFEFLAPVFTATEKAKLGGEQAGHQHH